MSKAERHSDEVEAAALRFMADFLEGWPSTPDNDGVDGWRFKATWDGASGLATLTISKLLGRTSRGIFVVGAGDSMVIDASVAACREAAKRGRRLTRRAS